MLNVEDKIGDYILVQYIASGGFGEVWRAEKRTGVHTFEFALKFFRPKNQQGVNIEKFKREVATSQRLSGFPHIISVIEADMFQHYIYIVSEFANGGSLADWLEADNRQGKAESYEQALNITNEILKGLEYIHQQGIIHRDLKPANILIKKGIHCLADFGISTEIKTSSRAETNAGTYEYMPPEAFDKNPPLSVQTDIWAVGVILQQLLTGRLPFEADDVPPLIHAILRTEPKPMPEDIPQTLHEIVAKALQKNRKERFQSAAEMRQALRNFLHRTASDKELEEIREKEQGLEKKYKAELERQKLENDDRLAELAKELKDIKRKADLEKIQQKQNEIKRKLIEKERIDLDRQIAWYRDAILEKTEYLPSAVERLRITLGKIRFDELTEQFQYERLLERRAVEVEHPPEPEPSDTEPELKIPEDKPQIEVPKVEPEIEEIVDADADAAAQKYLERGFKWDKNDLDGKIALYTKALELKPDFPDAYNNRGLAYYRKQELDKAIDDYSKAVHIKPGFTHAFYHRAVAFQEKALWDFAIQDYSKVIELNPDYAAAFFSRGKVYLEKKQYDLAIYDFTMAIESNFKKFEAHNNRGLAYAGKQEYEQAIIDFDRAVEIEPEFLEALRNKRDAFRAIADRDKSKNQSSENTSGNFRAWIIWIALISVVALSYGLFNFCAPTPGYKANSFTRNQ
jgi:serine/threonine protein kinase/lipoprotein NlpI